jgi:uncharacterized protein DUF6931
MMSSAPPIQIRVLPEQLTRWGIPDGAVPVSRDGALSGDYVSALIGAQQYENAARVLVNVLPMRAAIRWVSECLGGAGGSPAATANPIAAVSAWLADPSDEKRRAAFSAGDRAGFATPEGSLALAVFLSEGSLAPPDTPAVAPPPGAAQKALLGALQLAAVRTDPQSAPRKWKFFADAGRRVLLAPTEEQRSK